MLTRPGSLSTLEARGGRVNGEGVSEDEGRGCHLVSMRVRMEVVVRDGTGLVLTYGRCGAATDELEDYVGNASEHSESPAHLTTRSG